jgi:hypothetical protein
MDPEKANETKVGLTHILPPSPLTGGETQKCSHILCPSIAHLSARHNAAV